MRQPGELLIGCVAHGVTHSTDTAPDMATRFEMVREAGVFDYVDRLAPDDELEQTLQAVQRTGLPVPAGSFVYTLGQDEALYEHNFRKARQLGSVVHNGEYVTDEWHEKRLEPWKSAMRALLDHHARHGQGRTLRISTEYIPGIDYGAGHRYSMFEHNVACAHWLRQEWEAAAGLGEQS